MPAIQNRLLLFQNDYSHAHHEPVTGRSGGSYFGGYGRISRRGDAYLHSLLVQGARSTLQATLKKAPDKQNRMQQWVIRLYGRVGYHKTRVAITNKHARQLWALLAKGETYDLGA